ncbi:MAG: hypothetical protein AAF334_06325, partial [Pseudomonadota bacterium]
PLDTAPRDCRPAIAKAHGHVVPVMDVPDGVESRTPLGPLASGCINDLCRTNTFLDALYLGSRTSGGTGWRIDFSLFVVFRAFSDDVKERSHADHQFLNWRTT